MNIINLFCFIIISIFNNGDIRLFKDKIGLMNNLYFDIILICSQKKIKLSKKVTY